MTKNTIKVFETELSELKQKAAPLIWSSPQGNLGSALLSLQQSDTDNLKKAIKGFEDTLEDIDQKTKPQEWATLQGNLADALHALGQQDEEDPISILNESMEAYKNVLMVCKRQEEPAAWASILNNIGMIFQLQGEISNGAHTLMKSVSAYNNALTLKTAEETPLDWAITQNNIGVSLQLLAEIKQDSEVLDESLYAYENAMQKVKLEETPLGWVTSMSNLYSLQRIIASKTNEINLAKKSAENAKRVVDFLADTSHAEYLKLAQKEKEKSEEVLKNLTKLIG